MRRRVIQWCAYYGDVSAIRFLLANGESLHRKLCYDGFAIHPERRTMRANLLGEPWPTEGVA